MHKLAGRIIVTAFHLVVVAGCGIFFFSTFPGYNGALDRIGITQLSTEMKAWITRGLSGAVLSIVVPLAVRFIKKAWTVDAHGNCLAMIDAVFLRDGQYMNRIISLFIAVYILGASLVAKGQSSSFPESVYEQFIIALIYGDKETILQLALPHRELNVLFDGMPHEHRLNAVHQIKRNRYRVLAVGEKSKLPDGRSVAVSETEAEAGWVLIANSNDPLPHRMQQKNGVWRVDAGDLIAARQAVRQKQRPGLGPPPVSDTAVWLGRHALSTTRVYD